MTQHRRGAATTCSGLEEAGRGRGRLACSTAVFAKQSGALLMRPVAIGRVTRSLTLAEMTGLGFLGGKDEGSQDRITFVPTIAKRLVLG
jgi:hypothetical protein